MRFSFRKIYLAAVAALCAIQIVGCADSDLGAGDSTDNFRFQAEMTSTTASRSFYWKSQTPQQGDTVEAVEVTSVRFMISELKLKQKDSISEIKVKTGAVVLAVDGSGPQLTTSSTIPNVAYDKVHLKFHRFNDGEAAEYSNNPDFADFTTGDRPTIIIKGNVIVNGASVPFTYASRYEEDLKLDVEDFAVDATSLSVLALALDVSIVFSDKDTGAILDPRDPENANRLDKQIKEALKIVKK